MKSGVVCIIGRPNVGKSTLLNRLLKHKVSITSPKPQTTRFPIQAVYEDEQGQILFVDTPGIFGKVNDPMAKAINKSAEDALDAVDLVIYMVDHTRERDFEENKALGIVRKVDAPKIMVINKIDVKKPTHMVQYLFMKDEFEKVIEISALTEKHLKKLINAIYEYLPEQERLVDTSVLSQPAINLDSKLFISEIIREKAFLNLRREVPYRVTVVVDELMERESGSLFIKARILTTEDRYTGMVIGKQGTMIREIGMASRKEIERATDKKVFLELTAETDPHWMDMY
jgi:GTPase